MDARAGVSSTTISNKVQLSPETFERTRESTGRAVREEAEYGRYGKGDTGRGAGYQGPSRERETGRDDNLNDRKVGCRNAPKLAITGWRGDKGEGGMKNTGARIYHEAPARTSYSG